MDAEAAFAGLWMLLGMYLSVLLRDSRVFLSVLDISLPLVSLPPTKCLSMSSRAAMGS